MFREAATTAKHHPESLWGRVRGKGYRGEIGRGKNREQGKGGKEGTTLAVGRRKRLARRSDEPSGGDSVLFLSPITTYGPVGGRVIHDRVSRAESGLSNFTEK